MLALPVSPPVAGARRPLAPRRARLPGLRFPRYQAYLREHRPATLIVWGPNDGYMPAEAAWAYLRDLPDAELHLTDGGHWLLETHFDVVVARMRDFFERVHAA